MSLYTDRYGCLVDIGECEVHRHDDGSLEITSCDDLFFCAKPVIEQMVATHNKQQIIVNAAKIIAANQDDTGDVDLYMCALDDLIAGVAAL